MYRLIVNFCAFATFSHALKVIGPSADLTIVNADLAPDGFTRSTVVPDGTFPGPLIRGIKGDEFRLNVHDLLNDDTMLQSTSIHWHGLFQHGSNDADGVAFVTQCPIAANHSFMYKFEVPDQAGSFWYHSHLGLQYCDGLRGPFVVYDGEDGCNDPHRHLYDFDDENTIITLADWYHLPTSRLATNRRAQSANSTLINGKGRFGGDPTADLAVINVAQGKRYRLRIISMSCDPHYVFSIDGHSLTLIEADGENLDPTTVTAVDVFASQRYSAILHADQPVDNYWIRAKPNIGQFLNFDNGVNSAILRYVGAGEDEPVTDIQVGLEPVKEKDLHALASESPRAPGQPYPGGADVVLNMTIGFNNDTLLFNISGVPFIPPTVPVLLQILSGARKAQELLPSGSIFPLPLNKVVEINLIGVAPNGAPHPFHLHGHSFSVVKSADTPDWNFDNPVRRDVTPANVGNLTTIRFVTDNAGPWFLHCHVDFHLENGLAVVLAEDVPDIRATTHITDAWNDLCPIYSSLSGDQL